VIYHLGMNPKVILFTEKGLERCEISYKLTVKRGK
jgi:hypothetical protein